MTFTPFETARLRLRPQEARDAGFALCIWGDPITGKYLSDPVLEALVSFLGAGDTAQAVSRYAEFVCRLYATGKRTLAGYIQHIVTNDENAYIRMIGSGSAAYGQGWEMDAIAACVVGGISFTGGIGKISGVVVGVFIFTALTYSLTTLGIDTNLQFVFSGIIILVAVMLDCLKYVQKK